MVEAKDLCFAYLEAYIYAKQMIDTWKDSRYDT